MKFVVAGLGSIGRRHLKNLLALGESDIVLLRSQKSTLPDDELKAWPVETELASVLALQPEAMIIANPTALHLELAIPAAAAGCHILLEKPIAHSLDKIPELIAAVKKGGGELLVGFQYRFHPTLQTAYRLLKEGAIGRPVSLNAHWGEYLPNWHPWEDFRHSYAARQDLGGGVVLTLCHPFDYLSWLLGKPDLLWARTDKVPELGIEVEALAEACFRFPAGAIGTVHLDYLQEPASHRLEIIGTAGTLRWDNSDGRLAVYKRQQASWEEYLPPAGFNRNDLFLEQMRHFINVAKRQAKPLCTLEDGVNALQIALAVTAFPSGVPGSIRT